MIRKVSSFLEFLFLTFPEFIFTFTCFFLFLLLFIKFAFFCTQNPFTSYHLHYYHHFFSNHSQTTVRPSSHVWVIVIPPPFSPGTIYSTLQPDDHTELKSCYFYIKPKTIQLPDPSPSFHPWAWQKLAFNTNSFICKKKKWFAQLSRVIQKR